MRGSWAWRGRLFWGGGAERTRPELSLASPTPQRRIRWETGSQNARGTKSRGSSHRQSWGKSPRQSIQQEDALWAVGCPVPTTHQVFVPGGQQWVAREGHWVVPLMEGFLGAQQATRRPQLRLELWPP